MLDAGRWKESEREEGEEGGWQDVSPGLSWDLVVGLGDSSYEGRFPWGFPLSLSSSYPLTLTLSDFPPCAVCSML